MNISTQKLTASCA